MIYILVGPSCTGKTSCLRLISPEYRIKTCTTRPIRLDETEGVDYYFVTQEEFNDLAKHNELFEKNEYGGYWYGLPFSELKNAKGINDYFIILDPNGAKKLQQAYPNIVKTIFFMAPMKTVEERLQRRNEENTQQRILEFVKGVKFMVEANYLINSSRNDLEYLYEQFYEILNKGD